MSTVLRRGLDEDVYLSWWHTTGRRVFAEGLKPSAKALQPSAKDLPRAALGEEPSGKKTSAKESLPRAFYRALGKVFAEG